MKKYVITTDSTCDLPASFTQENNVDVIPVLYSINDVVYGTPDSNMDIKEFYDAMRNGLIHDGRAAGKGRLRPGRGSFLRSHPQAASLPGRAAESR